jgi:hypothetical protein
MTVSQGEMEFGFGCPAISGMWRQDKEVRSNTEMENFEFAL